MRKFIVPGMLVMACVISGSAIAGAQDEVIQSRNNFGSISDSNTLVKTNQGKVIVPLSSIPAAQSGTTLKTMTANTNLLIYKPMGWNPAEVAPPRPGALPPYAGYAYETPASLGCVYTLVTTVSGCNPNTVQTNPSGGTKAIAIVDAYDDPWAGPDLAYFSAQFGLPFAPAQLQVVYEGGVEPPIDITGGWEVEESLDIEYAHAMAPSATIYLVEAQSNYYSDLLSAVQIASNLVHCKQTTTCPTTATGTGEVSMSWGGGEFSGETSYDSYFTTAGVVYFAAAGDGPGTIWPCTSPNVVCAGGTTLRRNPSNGNFIEERTWESGGGGVSLYEKIPSYQSSIATIVGKARGVPDVALDSNPITGWWVWDSNYFEEDGGGWFIVGGTSAATPAWAGIVNKAGGFAASSNAELTKIYTNKAVATDFNDIKLGDCGPYAGYLAVTGWDPCTGVGSDHGYTGK
jgi:kumamolisin